MDRSSTPAEHFFEFPWGRRRHCRVRVGFEPLCLIAGCRRSPPLVRFEVRCARALSHLGEDHRFGEANYLHEAVTGFVDVDRAGNTGLSGAATAARDLLRMQQTS